MWFSLSTNKHWIGPCSMNIKKIVLFLGLFAWFGLFCFSNSLLFHFQYQSIIVMITGSFFAFIFHWGVEDVDHGTGTPNSIHFKTFGIRTSGYQMWKLEFWPFGFLRFTTAVYLCMYCALPNEVIYLQSDFSFQRKMKKIKNSRKILQPTLHCVRTWKNKPLRSSFKSRKDRNRMT